MRFEKRESTVLDKVRSNKASTIKALLDDFMESDIEVAELKDWTEIYDKAETCASGIRYQIGKFYPDMIGCYNRKDGIYLKRLYNDKPEREIEEDEYIRSGGIKDKLLSLESIEDELEYVFCPTVHEECDFCNKNCPITEDGHCPLAMVKHGMAKLKGEADDD